jgi:SAM-dependent methyltransferase
LKLILTDNQRIKLIVELITGWFLPGNRLLDLGSGEGWISHYLRSQHYPVTPVDVRNFSRFADVNPILYDGSHLPFSSNSFDVCLLLTVLHHIPQPEVVINEALRVAQRLIIIEDIYRSRLGRWSAVLGCSLLSWQFRNHPHSNKSDAEWKASFDHLGLNLLAARYVREIFIVFPFYHGAYLVERKTTAELIS